MPPHKRSKITLLNSRGTADSFPVSTLVTPDSNYNSDNSRVQMHEKVLLWFVCQLLIFNNRKYIKDWVHSTQHHRTAGLKPEIILLLRKNKRSLYHWRKKGNIIFINKAESKISLKVSVMQCYGNIRLPFWFSIPIDVTKNCDYRFQSVKLTK